jgi:hypothetical protein
MRQMGRILAAIVLALGCTWVPMEAALACSCGFPGYREAIAMAEVAFVGTVVGATEPEQPGGDINPMATVAFDVSRSRDPMPSPFELGVTFGGGANCGFDMAIGEEWLVIASAHEGRMQTNLCNGTALTDSLDADTRLVLDAALQAHDPLAPDGGNEPDPAREPDEKAEAPAMADEVPASPFPTPVLVAIGAFLVIGGISVVAFRREGRP